MPFQAVVLWTDWLVYLLVLVIVATAAYVRSKAHLRAPWRRVAQSVSGMIGLVVLLVFVAAGLLDSVHFRPRLAMSDPDAKAAYAVEVLSVLDLVLEPLRTRREKTYSAPLATQLYAREMIERPDGGQAREFPRLKYGGARLKDPERDWAGDVARRALGGVAGGAVVWLLLGLLAVMAAARASGARF
ncbi:MAG: ABC transporter permease, partial [Burkholderiales bacterium]|nr:ABC transporter permease [Burkholderiales bacterium]